jgi:ABC-type uncharacterized transport system substrate-binding protein
MKANLFFKLVASILFVNLLALQNLFAAGFHYQFDLTAKLVNNPQNEITAIQMSWVYDKELSAILMDGEDLSEAKREETLKRRAADILTGLRDVNYFTTVSMDKTAIEFAEVETYALHLNKESRLQLNLTLPFKEKQILQGHSLEILVTDDSAIGLATFIDTDHMLLSDALKALCKAPSLIQRTLAEIDGHAQITETMTIDCKA